MTGKEKKKHKKKLKYSTTQKNYQNLNNWTFISPLDYHYLLMKVSSYWFFYGFQLSPFRNRFWSKTLFPQPAILSFNLASSPLFFSVRDNIFWNKKVVFCSIYTPTVFFCRKMHPKLMNFCTVRFTEILSYSQLHQSPLLL